MKKIKPHKAHRTHQSIKKSYVLYCAYVVKKSFVLLENVRHNET
jgi:hypothetical protein